MGGTQSAKEITHDHKNLDRMYSMKNTKEEKTSINVLTLTEYPQHPC